jgi:deazaflavin-dependent oxidoreductase (nitroreductase family)
MMRKPNAIQKWLHRFFMLPAVTAFFAPRVHRIDRAVLKLTGGKLTASEVLGWNMIQLTTIGAKTGQTRTMPLIGMFDGEKIALVASSFGREHNPGWYYNLKVHALLYHQVFEVERHRDGRDERRDDRRSYR